MTYMHCPFETLADYCWYSQLRVESYAFEILVFEQVKISQISGWVTLLPITIEMYGKIVNFKMAYLMIHICYHSKFLLAT